MTENRFLVQALLHQELQRLKERRAELKRLAKENAKAAKAARARRSRLLKAGCLISGRWETARMLVQAARNLSRADLELLLRAQGAKTFARRV